LTRLRARLKSLKAVSLLYLTTSVRRLFYSVITPLTSFSRFLGLISQVAEELWEVADKTIKNLTKQDISIVDYKKNLVRQSTYFPIRYDLILTLLPL
jgi:hypothetical protein